ncbi:MAG: Gfo/Idh/MocA family oxidoreductase [Planctomycetia bacterium]|nr:Gfo/Idh/MocA family oxidoreductase [Planctomycetia bacterium]
MNRRTFSKSVATTAFGLAALQTSTSGARILGANDRVRCGFIGIANRGGQLIRAFEDNPDDLELTALCDVDSVTLGKVMEAHGNKPFATKDFREVLARNDVDAIVIATPDHWHAVMTVEACKAGKDVYCEKPLCVTVHEGRVMVDAARKYNRVVQVGTHRRSAPHYRKLAETGGDKLCGFVTMANSFHASNHFPNGIGHCQPVAPPETLDWDLWLGPRPERPFQENIAPYKFRWWHLYSSQMGNWGVHYLDAMRWILGETAPTSVCAMGGQYVVDDDRDIPDTLHSVFAFASGRLMTFIHSEGTGNPMFATDANYRSLGEMELRGTDGTMYITDRHVKIYPERGGRFTDHKPRSEAREFPGTPLLEIEQLHAKNFLDCVRTRQKPNCDVEEGHRSTTMSHIANISLAMKQRLEWDAQAERFTNCDAANEMLHYEYRKPWKLEI